MFSKPTGGQVYASAPTRTANNFPFRAGEICPCDAGVVENAVETARTATIAFTAAITLRWFSVQINGETYKVDLGYQLMTPATATADIAQLKAKLSESFGGVNGSLFGGAQQLSIAVVSTNLVITITSAAAYLPVSIQTGTASVSFV